MTTIYKQIRGSVRIHPRNIMLLSGSMSPNRVTGTPGRAPRNTFTPPAPRPRWTSAARSLTASPSNGNAFYWFEESMLIGVNETALCPFSPCEYPHAPFLRPLLLLRRLLLLLLLLLSGDCRVIGKKWHVNEPPLQGSLSAPVTALGDQTREQLPSSSRLEHHLGIGQHGGAGGGGGGRGGGGVFLQYT